MGKVVILILALFSLTNCVTFRSAPSYNIDATLQYDASLFFQKCVHHLSKELCLPKVPLEMGVETLEWPLLGECIISTPSQLDISISDRILEEAMLRRLIVYHELAHCIFDIDHHDDDIDIMNSTSQYDLTITQNLDFYLKKLFDRVRKEQLE